MAIIKLRQPAYPAPGFGWGRRGQEFDVFQNEMNRLFERFFGSDLPGSAAGVFPPVNVYQDGDDIIVTAELPGIESSEIKIDVEEDGLQIQGERKIEKEGENLCYHRREREGGSFSRKLSFKTKIDKDKTTASLKNGILKITLPKSKESRPKKIDVKTE